MVVCCCIALKFMDACASKKKKKQHESLLRVDPFVIIITINPSQQEKSTIHNNISLE